MFVRLMMSFLLVIMGFGGTQSASAGEIDLLRAFGDFALREPPDPPPPGGPKTYSATGQSPQWFVSQWNIAGGKLSPFVKSQAGQETIFTSQAPEADVRIIRTPTSQTVILGQNGTVLPCLGNTGRPRESDLFISTQPLAGLGSATATQRAAMGDLSTLTALREAVDITAQFGPTEKSKGCQVNKGGAVTALILSNPVVHPGQTLFYQLSLGGVCRQDVPRGICNPPAKGLVFYSNKNPFGVNDTLALVSGSSIVDGQNRKFDIDLLPRLRQAIASAPAGMDRELSHWYVKGAYAGHIIWGDVVVQSTWKNYQIIAVAP